MFFGPPYYRGYHKWADIGGTNRLTAIGVPQVDRYRGYHRLTDIRGSITSLLMSNVHTNMSVFCQ